MPNFVILHSKAISINQYKNAIIIIIIIIIIIVVFASVQVLSFKK